MREVIHSFGERNCLSGIVTLPESKTRQVAVLFLNAGSIHKVGPYGMNRDFARLLCQDGYRVMRFDFGGIGDSVRNKVEASQRDVVLMEMVAALDLLEKQYGESRIITIGLCTGAENGFRLAVVDPRVVGNVWLDGYGYKTLKGTVLKYWIQFSSLSMLIARLRRRLKSSSVSDASEIGDDGEWQWTLPRKTELSDDLSVLGDRGVKFLCIYSGGVISYYTYRDQFRDAFPGAAFLQNMEFDYFFQADHTYKINKDRHLMFERVRKWLDRVFG